VLRMAEPERRAEERAANLMFNQIQDLEDLTYVVESGTLKESNKEETDASRYEGRASASEARKDLRD
jgi:hypothetical protein